MTSPRWPLLVVVLALLVAAGDVALLVQRSTGDDPAPAPSPTARAETLDQQLARVARAVEDIRGLRFPAPPQPTYLTPDEMAERIAAITAEYTPEDAENDLRLLRTLGAVPRDYDLLSAVTELLTEQVAGYYETETGELVVLVDEAGRRLSPLEELFLAHELEHALADATLGLPEEPDGELVEDAALAATALIEGDATLTMAEYASVGFSLIDQLRFAGESLAQLQQLEVLESVPWVLRRSLEFPYTEGLDFVTALHDGGGWPAVDAAYERPPASTAQVLFPQRYLDGELPVPVAPAGEPGGDWQLRTRDALGAADLLFLFEAPGDDPGRALDRARERAGAWAGGAVTLWAAGDLDAVAVVLADRTAGDLCDAVAAWYLLAFQQVEPRVPTGDEVFAVDGPEQDAVLRCPGGTVRLGIAPDLATARRLVAGS